MGCDDQLPPFDDLRLDDFILIGDHSGDRVLEAFPKRKLISGNAGVTRIVTRPHRVIP